MTDTEDASSHEVAGPGDADLVLRTRSGDAEAFGELWRRHYRSGIIVARNVSPGTDADDLVQEAYTRIFQSILKGGGPTGSFRAYLFTSIRNTAAGWGRSRRETPIDVLELMEDPATTEQATAESLDRGLTHQAFRSLPSRWQEVLWYSEIEQMKPAEIAPLLGMKATAVAQLTFRAREGLREAWIQAHLRTVADGSRCAWAIERLGAYARSNIGRRDRARVEGHLADCARCAIVASEAKEVSSRLALVLIPLTVGVAGTAGYLATLQGGGAPFVALAAMPSSVMQGAVTVGSGSVASAAGAGGSSIAGAGSAGVGSSAGAGSALGAGSAAGAGSAVGAGSTATAGAATAAAGTAGVTAGAGTAAATATVTSAVVATGGMLTSTGVAGLAAAGLVVAGTVIAAVALPDGPTSADIADARSTAIMTEEQRAPDPDKPLEMIEETSVPISESDSPAPADIPVLPAETGADAGSSTGDAPSDAEQPEQSSGDPAAVGTPGGHGPADPGSTPGSTNPGNAYGDPGTPGDVNPGPRNPNPGNPNPGNPGPEVPGLGTGGTNPGTPHSGNANSGPGNNNGGGRTEPEGDAVLPESMPSLVVPNASRGMDHASTAGTVASPAATLRAGFHRPAHAAAVLSSAVSAAAADLP